MPQGTAPIILGDTIHWLPLDEPSMIHTITSTEIPEDAIAFDEIWQAPDDTFFQYIPAVTGVYNYICIPHQENGMTGQFTVEEDPLGIDDQIVDTNPIIYPNPTQNKLFIDQTAQGQAYRVLNLSGAVVKSGTTSESIEVSQLQAGVYIIELIGDRIRLFKFVKE